ncbi:uncharacterized protein LOC130046551 [Ostrea edulis]|uniref:uncharacterized protein LOC130046551 n=1 Tax=Ostrea edulis TaxID=37623 RepID=UPI0024AFB80D|nr:uncharacterized protein LOC130046551 [Ostrea edulis]
MNGHSETNPAKTEHDHMPTTSEQEEKPNIVQRMANKTTCFFETGFERIGILISTHPWKTILVSTIIAGLFSISNVVSFTETNRRQQCDLGNIRCRSGDPQEIRRKYLSLNNKIFLPDLG